jgi:uncharacterized protein YeaO (DUF488 family)
VARIRVKRVYEPVERGDGKRFLVERLWPRGFTKASLAFEAWLKDVGPSAELRRWYGHDPAKWDEFRRRYYAELDANPEALAPIREAARRGPVTLLFSARDLERNSAVALRAYLARKPGRRGRRFSRSL